MMVGFEESEKGLVKRSEKVFGITDKVLIIRIVGFRGSTRIFLGVFLGECGGGSSCGVLGVGLIRTSTGTKPTS